MKDYILKQLQAWKFEFLQENLIVTLIHFFIIIIICGLIYWITRRIVLNHVHNLAEKTKTKWDDMLVKENFFKKLAALVPITIVLYSLKSILDRYEDIFPIIYNVVEIILVVTILQLIISFLNAFHRVLETNEKYKDKPLQSYVQLTKIVLYIIFSIIIFSFAV